MGKSIAITRNVLTGAYHGKDVDQLSSASHIIPSMVEIYIWNPIWNHISADCIASVNIVFSLRRQEVLPRCKLWLRSGKRYSGMHWTFCEHTDCIYIIRSSWVFIIQYHNWISKRRIANKGKYEKPTQIVFYNNHFGDHCFCCFSAYP